MPSNQIQASGQPFGGCGVEVISEEVVSVGDTGQGEVEVGVVFVVGKSESTSPLWQIGAMEAPETLSPLF